MAEASCVEEHRMKSIPANSIATKTTSIFRPAFVGISKQIFCPDFVLPLTKVKGKRYLPVLYPFLPVM